MFLPHVSKLANEHHHHNHFFHHHHYRALGVLGSLSFEFLDVKESSQKLQHNFSTRAIEKETSWDSQARAMEKETS